MRSCRQIGLEDIGGNGHRFLVDTSAEPSVLRQLTDPGMAREPLGEGVFLWVDVATSPGAAILLGAHDGDSRGAVATRVDLDAVGTDPRSCGVFRLRSSAEYWLPCCGAGIDGWLSYTGRCCSLGLEHLLDADELLPIPPIAAAYEPRPAAGQAIAAGGERWHALHCSGMVMVPGQLWSLWSDAGGSPHGWELHPAGAAVAESVRTPRYAREQHPGHVTTDGVVVDHRFPLATELEALCRPLAYGMRLLDS